MRPDRRVLAVDLLLPERAGQGAFGRRGAPARYLVDRIDVGGGR
jgi:hypothetical protein